MGADFLLARCPVDHEWNDASERLQAMSNRDLFAAVCRADATDVEEVPAGPDVDDDGAPIWDGWIETPEFAEAMGALRSELAEFLEEVYGGGNRELASMLFDGRGWVLTGGMSHGDSPTESYRLMYWLIETELTYDRWDLSEPAPEPAKPASREDPGPCPVCGQMVDSDPHVYHDPDCPVLAQLRTGDPFDAAAIDQAMDGCVCDPLVICHKGCCPVCAIQKGTDNVD